MRLLNALFPYLFLSKNQKREKPSENHESDADSFEPRVTFIEK